MNYFIIVNDSQQGPYSVEELRQRNISSETLVWAEGMQQWTPAWQVEELKPLFYQTTGAAASASAQAGTAQTASAQAGTAQAASTQAATGSVPPPPPINNQYNPYHPGAPMEPAGKKKKKTWTYVGIAVAVLLLLMAVLNPSKDEHKQVIKERISNGLFQALSDHGDASDDPFATFGSAFIRSMAAPVVGQLVENMLQYHNYLFWSTTTLTLPDSSEARTSFGIFGKVFTSDETAIAEAVSKTLKSDGNMSTHSSVVKDSGTDEDGNPYSGVTQTVTDSVVSVGSKVGKAVVRHVSSEIGNEIKKQLDQDGDSAAASGLDKIIDDIESFLKGL